MIKSEIKNLSSATYPEIPLALSSATYPAGGDSNWAYPAGRDSNWAGKKQKSLYDRGFSFFSLKRASNETPETFTTLNRTPGISPTACPLRPNPAMRTSSCRREGKLWREVKIVTSSKCQVWNCSLNPSGRIQKLNCTLSNEYQTIERKHRRKP